jgi:hypothetical protein
MRLRSALPHAEAAAADPRFTDALHRTLKAWGLGLRQSRLRPLPRFEAALQAAAPSIVALESGRIDDEALDVEQTTTALWSLIERLDIVENDAPLVGGTKALHHFLPDLLPPMDRTYTQKFFRWHNPQFQYGQEKCFRLAFGAFVYVARQTDARRYVGTHPWNTSISKVLDNALVGLVHAVQGGVDLGA